jgi:putative ABC transport system substrate-binding protein
MRCRAVGFIVTLALSILAAPLAAAGQPAGKIPRIGWLSIRLPSSGSDLLNAFREGLRALGYVESQNIAIEYRWAEGRFERLPELAAELVRLPVDLIVAAGTPATRAAKQATSTVPIVVPVMHEPVVMGFVASLARPGGNITGQAFQDSELSTKRLEQLKEMVPNISRIAVLWDPTDGGATALQATEKAAQALGLALQVLEVRGPNDFARAFEAAHKAQAHALMQPADLPVEQPRKFELVIHLKTAKERGLTIPPSLLFQADEVIK